MINRISYRAYVTMLQDVEYIAKDAEIDLRMVQFSDPNMKGVAYTGYADSDIIKCDPGNLDKRRVFTKYSMKDVTSFIVHFFHEYKHIMQKRDAFHNHDYALAFARNGNNGDYMTSMGRYHSDFTELEAELFGIISAYEYLSESYGTDTAEKYIVDYVYSEYSMNYGDYPYSGNTEWHHYYIDNDFSTVDEIVSKFQCTIESVKQHRPNSSYDPLTYYRRGRERESDHIAVIAWHNPEVWDKLKALENNADERDRFVAAVMLEKDPAMRKAYHDVELPHLSDFGIDGSHLDFTIGHDRNPAYKDRDADELVKDIEIPDIRGDSPEF